VDAPHGTGVEGKYDRGGTLPANWHLDDWPPFQPEDGGSHGFVDPHVVERMWKEHFTYCYREYDEFVFPISIHPQVSGKPQVLLMHERLIEWINEHHGVEWCTFDQMVDEFKDGVIAGAKVEGGAEAKTENERRLMATL
jgi:hypothetical protein